MKALVVAGGMPQITLINQLKERNVETILVDGSPTPVALPYADKFTAFLYEGKLFYLQNAHLVLYYVYL